MKTKFKKLLSGIALLFLVLGSVFTLNVQAEDSSLITVNKTASNLDNNLETSITLSLSGKEDKLASDIVFVLDKSGASDQTGINAKALEFLQNLSEQAEAKKLNVKVGVVLFNRVGNIKLDLTDIRTSYDKIQEAMKSKVNMGTNLHAGLLAGKKLLDDDTSVDNSRKHLVLITDGATYLYSKNNDYTTSYTRSFDDPKKQTNPVTGQPYINGSDKKGGIWEYQSREYNVKEDLTFSNAMKSPEKLEEYLNIKRQYDNQYSQYEYVYDSSSAYFGLGRKTTPIEANAVANIDAAFIHSVDTFDQIAAKYKTYVFYKNAADFDGSTLLKYMTRNTGGLATDFAKLENAIYSLVAKGSSLGDIIGKDFDFVNDINKISLKLGNDTLKVTKLSANEYGFGEATNGIYPYVLTYTPGDGEKLHLQINETIQAEKPLVLTYSEKLVNIPTGPGKYTFDTNEEAILNPVDSNGNNLAKITFPKPKVQYTVLANNGTVTIKYVDEQGKEIAAQEVLTGKIGSSYTTSSKSITGYTFIKLDPQSAKETGTYTKDPQVVIYIYTKTKPTTPIKTGDSNPLLIWFILTISSLLIFVYIKKQVTD